MIKSLTIEKFRLFENQEFKFGKRITAISGQNAVGKSTLLGLIGNIVELKSSNIFGKHYRTDFSEVFKASPNFDKTGEHKGTFYLGNPDSSDDYEVSFRSTWQNDGKRFRIIPDRKDEHGNKVASKYPLPVIYLGLSRLYPIGETTNTLKKDDLNLTDEEKTWFADAYSNILTMSDVVEDISNLKTKEVKSNFTGITTQKYDAFCNSAGQDNLGQILLSIISFKRLRQKTEDWEGGLLIIDELDATLHPVAQQKLVSLLFKQAKFIDLQVIFTTHSLSTLEFIASKYEGKSNFGADYKLIFISNANNIIKVYHNPKYELIKNNLCLTMTQIVRQKRKLLVFSEDDETRWFFKKLIYGYANKLKLITANLGCGDLCKLLKEDNKYFSNVLFVVDGDVKKTNPLFVKKGNVVALIGDIRPEKVLYDYLNDENCTFWQDEQLETEGMTKQYFITENGPLSSKYKNRVELREKYSSWFHDQKEKIEQYKMFEHWKKHNHVEVTRFRNEFIQAYNKLAETNEFPKIEKKK
jgi:predicted ATPase